MSIFVVVYSNIRRDLFDLRKLFMLNFKVAEIASNKHK